MGGDLSVSEPGLLANQKSANSGGQGTIRAFVRGAPPESSPFVLRSGGGTWPPGLAACASAPLRHPDFLQRQKVGAGHPRTVTVVLGPALASLIESERGRERPGEGEKPKRG